PMLARSFAVFVGLLVCANVAAQTPVFINELHYDNTGTDANETIEIAAPANTNLTGWSLVLYNGSGGVSYDTLQLNGSVPDLCNGHGVLTVSPSLIQNGAPDGIALVNSAGAVVQFLSYEGSFAATNGPAVGMQSVDIGVSESESTPATSSLALTGTGAAYESFSWGIAATATFGACNTGQTFTGGVDTAPTVTSTSPTNGTSNAATTTNIVIAFSESVTVSGEWFGIVCGTSGNLGVANAVVSNVASSTYTINPNSDFASGEQCAVTVFASQVVDQDGTPQNLAQNHTFGFTTAADVPPSVAFVAPSAGATNVPVAANVLVTFSEAVTAPPAAFGLTCGAASQPFALSGGPTQFTLNPSADLPESTPCTLGITGSQVVDLDGTPNPMQGDYSTSFTTGAIGADYYATADASSAAALRATLHDIIDDHTRIPYTADETDTWDVLKLADEDPLDTTRILDIYRNASYVKAPGGNTFYNREHTWPNSLGFPTDGPDNSAYTDTHMLMLSDIGHNAARGNLPFGTCTSGESFATLVYFGQGGPGQDNLRCGAGWQTWVALRGNVARAILYMDIRYEGGTHGVTGFVEPDLRLTDNASLIVQSGGNATVAYMGLLATLLQWHQQDPPDEREVLRNGIIQSYQGNRNPFVDHPEWAACLYSNQCNAPAEIVFANGFE
ncbi:MAG: Ig-like domain-containing protein, partial [Lysobacterales bacterium]